MNSNEYQVEIDNLALGLTRPPIFMGVNLRLFFGNVMLCALIFIDFHSLFSLPLFFVIHLTMSRLSFKEPNFFSIYLRTFIKCSPVFNRRFWGNTNSYMPW